MVEALRENTGASKVEILARILEWFSTFDDDFQAAVLNRKFSYRKELARRAIERMIQDPEHDQVGVIPQSGIDSSPTSTQNAVETKGKSSAQKPLPKK